MSDPEVKRKPYESPARTAAAQARRRRIIAAASELFAREGFDATTMTTVAVAAGVSERTVYLAFATKATLLNECIRAAVRGVDQRTPMLAQGGWQAALNAPPEQMLGLLADATAELMSRAARLLAAGESVGLGDPQLHEFRQLGRAATHADAMAVAKALKRAGMLRKGLAAHRAADIIYAIAASESLYLRLVDHRGWSAHDYARLLEQALSGALTN
jgi:AcrR family transcriptional regulator